MKKSMSLLVVLIAAGSIGGSVFSQESKWTTDHILNQESISGVDIAPDGNRVLWVKRAPDSEKDRYVSDIYLTYRNDPSGKTGPQTVRLTRTGDNSDPKFSPDGSMISFVSSRTSPDGKVKGRQIWLLDPRGGEPYPLTKLENGVSSVSWIDTETLLFSAREEDSYYETELKKKKDDVSAVEDTTLFYPVRLFSIKTSGGNPRRVSSNAYRVTEFSVDPTGKWVVFSEDESPIDTDGRSQPRQYLLELATGVTTEIFATRYFDPSGFAWKLDGSGFYASDETASDPEWEGAGIDELYFFDLLSRAYRKVELDWANGIGSGGYTITRDGIHVQLADGPRMTSRFYYQSGQAWRYEAVQDQRFRTSTSLQIGPDGETIVFVYSRADVLPQYLIGSYKRGTVQDVEVLTKINTYLEKLPIPKAEVIEWTGASGETVNGILYYPLDYEPGKRYPLVLGIHGGPSGVDLDAWRLSYTIYPGMWAERGAFMLRPNYHGSSHHGLEFVESIKGHYYELEIPDIINGIQFLVDQGKVDQDQLGLIGWSNGAILATALTVEYPEMFKVAAPGAGDVNWTSDYGNCAFGVKFDQSYFGGSPWDNTDVYIAKSPLFRLDRVVTPTLIHHGSEDTAVPTEQGWQYYRALQQIGKAPVRFLLYPGQPHGLGKISHQRRKIEEDLNWFDTWMFGKTNWSTILAGRVLPETSPLARLEETNRIARTNSRYGLLVNDILVPEAVVLGDSLHVGRFEVTRAQFQAFRPSYAVDSGKDNYPANGITLADARAYTRWLTEKTGTTYRLPTESESKVLKDLAGPEENTLAWWLGYSPTPDEQAELADRLKTVNIEDLLEVVGNRHPARKKAVPLLFDIGGNVSEWVELPDGTGQLRLACVMTVDDVKAPNTSSVPPECGGFRIVRSKP